MKLLLSGLTQALAVDIGELVRVNAIEPGAVDTPMLRAGFAENPARLDALAGYSPRKRIAHPEEVARLALFLASSAADFINGASIGLDGGTACLLSDPA